MARQLRRWTPEKVAQVIEYKKTHTHGETLAHFKISSAQLHVWINRLPAGHYDKKRRTNGAHKANGIDRTGALVYLEKWRKARLEHIRAGRDTHNYDVFAELALMELHKVK